MSKTKSTLAAQEAVPRRVSRAALNILRPLARLFIAHGVSFSQAERLLKQAFFDAGKQALPESEVSMSRLSVSTGLHRKEVRRLLEQESNGEEVTENRSNSLASALYARWMTDPTLIKRNRPIDLALRAGDDEPSFQSLARSISTDAHPRTLLEELKRLQLVEMTEEGNVRVRPGGYVPMLERTEMLDLLGESLADHVETAVGNVIDEGDKRLEQSVYIDELSASTVREIETLARSIWAQAMKKAVLAIKKAGDSDKKKGVPGEFRLRVGMYFYSDLPRHKKSTKSASRSNSKTSSTTTKTKLKEKK